MKSSPIRTPYEVVCAHERATKTQFGTTAAFQGCPCPDRYAGSTHPKARDCPHSFSTRWLNMASWLPLLVVALVVAAPFGVFAAPPKVVRASAEVRLVILNGSRKQTTAGVMFDPFRFLKLRVIRP